MRARRRVQPFAVIGAVATMAMALAACGASAGRSPSPSSSAASGNTISALLPAANKEGTVTWYTTFSTKDVPKMIAAFNKVYPGITVNPLRLSADKIPARVLTEQKAGTYNADVITADSPQVAQLIQAGAMQPFSPPEEAPLPAGLHLAAGYPGVVYLVTTVIAYNPSAVKSAGLTPPTSWQDLTQPQWKGKFSIDPGAVNLYESFIASMGQSQALALIQGLGKNKPILVSSHTLAVTQVQSGSPLAAATAYGYYAAAQIKKGAANVAFVNTNPLPASLNLVDIAKNAPHPAAAKLFEDWLVSQQGQQEVVSITDHTSIRTDVKNDTTVWDPSKWTPAWGNPMPTPTEYNQQVNQMKQALGAP
jgi:iron(III) transport system substrate-binding protein